MQGDSHVAAGTGSAAAGMLSMLGKSRSSGVEAEGSERVRESERASGRPSDAGGPFAKFAKKTTGFSIASIAKPMMMQMKFANKVRQRDPLDIAISASGRARADATKAMDDAGQKVEEFFKGHHDDQLKARALLAQSNKALVAMQKVAETLEKEASEARRKLLEDQAALGEAKSTSIKDLTAEREALIATYRSELYHSENDASMSISALLDRLEKLEQRRADEYAALSKKLSEHITNEEHLAQELQKTIERGQRADEEVRACVWWRVRGARARVYVCVCVCERERVHGVACAMWNA